MLTRFKDRSRRTVEAAFEEARMLGHDSLGDEDLLLGILRAGEGIAAEALSSLGVTLEDAREESEGMLSDALSSIGVSLEELRREAGDTFDVRLPEDRKIPFSPRAKNTLVRAAKRCEGWETATSAPSTSCWGYWTTKTGQPSGC
jgi:ATP-dependent Clp protease ATP-binding subunit ClpA